VLKKKIALIVLLGLVWVGPIRSAGTKSGQTELILGQVLNSSFLVIELSQLADLYYRQIVGLAVMGVSANVILPQVVAKRQSMSTARARSINSSSFWSATNGMFLGLALHNSHWSDQAAYGLSMDLGATVGAYATTESYAPNVRQLRTVNSAGVWGTAFGYATGEIADVDLRRMPWFLWLGQTAGLAGGVYVAQADQFTAVQMLQVDLYGLGGFVAGYGVAAMLGLGKRGRMIMAIIVTAAGLAGGVYQTGAIKGFSGSFALDGSASQSVSPSSSHTGQTARHNVEFQLPSVQSAF